MSITDFKQNKPINVGIWRNEEKYFGEVHELVDEKGAVAGYAAINDAIWDVQSQEALEKWLGESTYDALHTGVKGPVVKSRSCMFGAESSMEGFPGFVSEKTLMTQSAEKLNEDLAAGKVFNGWQPSN